MHCINLAVSTKLCQWILLYTDLLDMYNKVIFFLLYQKTA